MKVFQIIDACILLQNRSSGQRAEEMKRPTD